MARWGVVFFGFILTVILKAFFGLYEFPGLLIIGFIVGVMAHEGTIGGMWNAALAGAFGSIVVAILYILAITFGGSLFGPLGGLIGFTVSGISSLVVVILNIIYYAIVMGIAGAVGGAISSSRN